MFSDKKISCNLEPIKEMKIFGIASYNYYITNSPFYFFNLIKDQELAIGYMFYAIISPQKFRELYERLLS